MFGMYSVIILYGFCIIFCDSYISTFITWYTYKFTMLDGIIPLEFILRLNLVLQHNLYYLPTLCYNTDIFKHIYYSYFIYTPIVYFIQELLVFFTCFLYYISSKIHHPAAHAETENGTYNTAVARSHTRITACKQGISSSKMMMWALSPAMLALNQWTFK